MEKVLRLCCFSYLYGITGQGQMRPMDRDPQLLLAMGYTNRKIAESLGLTDEVVRMRLFRGRKLLWKELNSHE